MTRTMKCLSPLVALVLAVALLAACNGGNEPARDIYGRPPPLEGYLDTLLPGLAAMKELDRLDPQSYGSLVSRFRDGGLEALSETDRAELLLVAQIAFLSHVQTTRYTVTSRDTTPGSEPSHAGEATIEETFVRRAYSSTESTVSHMSARRVSTDHICWTWGLWPYWDPECQGEHRLFVDFRSGEPYVTPIMTAWNNLDGPWECSRTDPTSSYRYYAAELDYWGLFGGLAKAIPVGRDTLDGQPAYRLEDYEDRSVQYWLDADTLWLRQYEFEYDYEGEEGIRYTVTLEAINEDIVIEPPNVDVECVEEETE